jgi:hypothetical protein
VADRMAEVRAWVEGLGGRGALANAESELERRSSEHAMLEALEGRVLAVHTHEGGAVVAAA